MTQLIKPSKKHFTVDGTELAAARNKMGLTQIQFGELCGWSGQSQWKLERLGENPINPEKANKIIGAVSG